MSWTSADSRAPSDGTMAPAVAVIVGPSAMGTGIQSPDGRCHDGCPNGTAPRLARAPRGSRSQTILRLSRIRRIEKPLTGAYGADSREPEDLPHRAR